MMFFPAPQGEPKKSKLLILFVLVWTTLLVQHILTIIFTYTDDALSEPAEEDGTALGPNVRWLASIYIVTDVIFLLNAAVAFEVDPLKRFRPYIDSWTEKLNDKLNGLSSRVSESSK